MSTENVKIDELANIKDHSVSDKDGTTLDNNVISSSNGYQQVPIVIETSEADSARQSDSVNVNKLCVDTCSQRNSTASAYESDILDIKSYISQSRSDVSPFARSSSYRSQYGRSTHYEVNQLHLTCSFEL